MGCGCNKTRTGSRWELTLPKGKTFDDGATRRVYASKGEAVAAKRAMGGGEVREVKQ